MRRSSWLMLLAVVLLAVVPLAVVDGEWGGADGVAETVAVENAPGFQPTVAPVYEPPSGEVESGLFALQAALGAGVLGYVAGVYRTRVRLAGARPGQPAAAPRG